MRRTWLAAPLALALSACERDVPARYRALPVPVERLRDPAARELGEQLFARYCAICHGVRGGGQGERKTGLFPPPRDLGDPGWQDRISTLRIFAIIREGVPDTAMPSWAGTFSYDDTWDLVAYVRSLPRRSPRRALRRTRSRADRLGRSVLEIAVE